MPRTETDTWIFLLKEDEWANNDHIESKSLEKEHRFLKIFGVHHWKKIVSVIFCMYIHGFKSKQTGDSEKEIK